MVRIGRRASEPGREGTRLVDSLLENLACFVLTIRQYLIDVVGDIFLALGCVNTQLLEHPFHAEGPSLIRNYWHKTVPNGLILCQCRQHPNEGHRGRDLTITSALGLLLKCLEPRTAQWLFVGTT